MSKTHRITWLGWVILVCSLLWLLPLVLIFLNSFKSYNDMMQNFLAWPTSWSLDRYIDTWNTFNFPKLIKNTLEYTIFTVIGTALIAPMASYKLARTKTWYSKVVFILIIIPMMVPFQTYMITLTRLTSMINLSGTKVGYILVSIGLCTPLAVYMIHGFIKNVPISLEESATIDGAGPFRTYFAIVLPLLKPILTTVIVLDALGTWNDIITNQLIIGSKESALNLQNALYMRFSAQTSDWEHALPGIVISMIPSLAFFILMQKNIIGGVTAGAVKG